MKLTKSLIASAVAAVMTSGVVATAQAEVEVGASVGVASAYLWRGYDLGNGTPAVSGDLNVSSMGFYGGVWGSSGDTTAGSEYDLYVGYGGGSGDFSYDVSLWTYTYPVGPEGADTDTFALSDLVVSLGYGPVALTHYANIADGCGNCGGEDAGYSYTTLGAGWGAFGFTLGMHSEGFDNMQHFDLSYAYNDNLSFIVSSEFGSDNDTEDSDPKFVVSYSLPLGE